MENNVINIADALPGILEKRLAMSKALIPIISGHPVWEGYESAYRAARVGLGGKSLYHGMVIIARLDRMNKGFSRHKALWSTLLPENGNLQKYRLEKERKYANQKIIAQLGKTGMNEEKKIT